MELLRHQRLVYMNTGTSTTPKYSLVGQGFTDLTTAANAQTSSRQYVHQQNAQNALTGYAPAMSFVSVMDSEDTVSVYLQEKADELAVGEAAATDIVVVDTWKNGTGEGTKVARKQDVSIQFDNPGSGAAGTELALTGSLSYVGNPVKGEFNTTTKAFQAA